MKLNLRQLDKKFATLSRRERWIIALIAAALLVAVLQLLVVDVLSQKQQKRKQELEQLNTQMERMQQDIKILTFALQVGPDREERQRIIDLELDINRVRTRLMGELGKLVAAEQVPNLMKEMLALERKVRLVSLKNLPVEKLVEQKHSKNQIRGRSGLYKHSFEMVVRGRYLDVYQFLMKVQNASWQFFWDEMDYKVNNFPLAEVKFVVSTLSTNEAWIGL